LSVKELSDRIAGRKPIGPPGLNEPSMRIDGTAVACLCFAATGRVAQVSILSGPAMMQQPVLESLKGWRFRPVWEDGRRSGGCGTLKIHVSVNSRQVTDKIVE
jgi:hypothetical protein